MTPFAKYISIVKSPYEIAEKVKLYPNATKKHYEAINTAYNWTLEQTWSKLAEEYISLWN